MHCMQQEGISMSFCGTSGTQESFIPIQDRFTDCMLHTPRPAAMCRMTNGTIMVCMLIDLKAADD